MTPKELTAAVNAGILTVIDRIDCLPASAAQFVIQANYGDVNAAIAFTESLLRDDLGLTWLWHMGYDNLATLTSRDTPEDVIRVISMNPAHALLLATLQAWERT